VIAYQLGEVMKSQGLYKKAPVNTGARIGGAATTEKQSQLIDYNKIVFLEYVRLPPKLPPPVAGHCPLLIE
jgi:hypothetical protein